MDFAEVLTGEDKSGFDRRIRLSIWRRGTSLLILRSQTTLEALPKWKANMDALAGSLQFLNAAQDPVIETLVKFSLALHSGKELHYLLPPGWAYLAGGKDDLVNAAIHINENDPDRANAMGLYAWNETPADIAQLDALSVRISNSLMISVLPDPVYKRIHQSTIELSGFEGVALQQFRTDRLELDNGATAVAMTFTMVHGGEVIGFTSISPTPFDARAQGDTRHTSFICRLIADQLRDFIGQGGT